MEDKRIVELLFARSEEALKRLKDKYGHLILHISKQLLSDIEDAIECENDTYLAIWNSVPPNNPEYFKAYVCKIARNIALKKVRKLNAQKRNNYTEITLDELGECITDKYVPHELIEAKELGRYINIFLDGLNEESRMLFIRRYFFGDSVDSLSERFGMRSNTISVKLSRLRKSLRAYLEEQEVEL